MTAHKLLFSKLSFDSRLFGYPVVRLEPAAFDRLATILPTLKSQGIRLVYTFADPSDKPANQHMTLHGGTLVDEKVIYAVKITRLLLPEDRSGEITSYNKLKPTKELLSLALESGTYSRFARDPHFSHGEFKTLYTAWLTRSLAGRIAFDVLVYRDERNIVRGFIALAVKDGQGNIGLLAVDKTFRRQAIGSQLVGEAFRRFDRKGLTTVMVTTQKANAAACRFYEKLGFRILKTEHVYHFWL